MNFDSIYQALSSLAQGINNIGQSATAISSVVQSGAYLAAYPAGVTPLTASSGNVAAATATATLAASPTTTAYITGFIVTSGGSTGAAVVNVTVVGVLGGTMTFNYGTLAGVTAINAPLVVQFPNAVPASALDTSIVVSMPTLGTGNTHAAIVAFGYTK